VTHHLRKNKEAAGVPIAKRRHLRKQ
jgi:hypothetical protein